MIETLDETIEQVETLYESVTGRKAPPSAATPYAEIPPEKDPNAHVGEQIERLLTSLAEVTNRSMSVPSWAPPVWLCHGADALLIQLDLPGVPRNDLRVRLGNGYLQVSGARPFPAIEGPRCPQYSEQRFGAFQRSIPIPPEVAADQVRAALRDGVLSIQVPKAPKGSLEARDVVVS